MTRVLVTGATGFVGRALLPVLKQAGFRVRAAVRGDATVCPPGADEVAAVGEIGPATRWEAALDGVDAVAHLAARVHVMRDTAADPLAEFRRVNRDGTRVLAEAAALAGVRRFVFVSSIKAMVEEAQDAPLAEDDPPRPGSPYGLSKLEAERDAAAAAAGSGMTLAVLRPPLVYGPHVGGNFRSLLKLCRLGVPLPLGGIRNRRSLIAVGNLADAIRVCLSHPEARGVFLPHDGAPLSTPDLLRRLAAALGRRAILVPVPASWIGAGTAALGRRAVWERLAGSLWIGGQRLSAVAGWQPPVSTEAGLAETAAWFRSRA